MDMLEQYVPIVHIVIAVFTVIELGLMAYVVTPYNDSSFGPPSAKSFMMFNAVFTLLVIAYLALTPRFFARFFHSIAALALESVTMLFWFAGSIALAANWASPRCGGNSYCGTLNAAVAFGFFLWALFTYLVVVDAWAFLRARERPTTAPAAKPTVVA